MKLPTTEVATIFSLTLLTFLCGCKQTRTINSQSTGSNVMVEGSQANVGSSSEGIDKSKLSMPDSPYIRVYINKSGVIALDGKAATFDEAGKAFAVLAKRKGVVLYARESPEEEPHPNAVKVLNLVIQNKLPVRLCMTMDCSDAIDANGKLIVGN
jgi:hypothetical protein